MKLTLASLIVSALCAWIVTAPMRDEPEPAGTESVRMAEDHGALDSDIAMLLAQAESRMERDDDRERGGRHLPMYHRRGPRGRGEDAGERRGPGWRMRDRDERDARGAPKPEDIEALLEVIEKHFPPLHERLVALREKNPLIFRRLLMRMHGPLSEIVNASKHQPELARVLVGLMRVQMELSDLQDKYAAAEDDAARAALSERIRDALAQRFDLRIARVTFEIREFEKRLEAAKERVRHERENKSSILTEEFERLIAGELEPPPPPPGSVLHGPPSRPGEDQPDRRPGLGPPDGRRGPHRLPHPAGPPNRPPGL